MAIVRKPKATSSTEPAINIDALIAKGGSVGETAPETGKTTISFTLRVPSDILIAVDQQIKQAPYKVPRQQWIMEAVMQRLEKEARE